MTTSSTGDPALRISSLFDVSGQVALVTGGGSGIGLMIATTLIANGCRVYIGSRKEGALKEVSIRTIKLLKRSPNEFETQFCSLR